MCPPVNRLGIYIGHMSATSLRLAVRIDGHVQPTCAVKVDTLLTEEKARAKLINEAKLKFGIMMIIIDVSGVRLCLDMQFDMARGMQFDMACGTAWHGVSSRCGPYPPSDPPFVQLLGCLDVGQRVPSA